MPSMNEVLTQNIRHFRTGLGLTQAHLAEAAGVSQNHIAEIEAGRKSPSMELLDGLSRALAVRPWELLMSEQERRDPQTIKRVFGDALGIFVRESVGTAVDHYFDS
ncbi:MAG: helix-turn-helix transcriptional regulator [Spirochaetales bacterium]